MQNEIWDDLREQGVQVLCFMTRTTESELREYVGNKGLTFPFVYNESDEIFNLYEVGVQWSQFAPSWFVVDQNGVVQMRLDAAYFKVPDIKAKIETLLNP